MAECKWKSKAEQWFDGEGKQSPELERHVASCPECAAHVGQLRLVRDAVEAAVPREEIRDAQFPAFMAGVRDGIDATTRARGLFRPRRGGLWAMASLAAASLIVAVSVMLVINDEPPKVDATVVEWCDTELDGATVGYESDNGVTTVWVTMSKEDVW